MSGQYDYNDCKCLNTSRNAQHAGLSTITLIKTYGPTKTKISNTSLIKSHHILETYGGMFC